MTHTYIYPCPGPINGCILNKIRLQYNDIANTRCYNHWQLGSKNITPGLGPPQTRVKKQETRNKKQNGLAHSRFIVCVTPKQKKNIAWFENQVLAEHVRKSQSTIYLKSHGCVHGFQNEVSLINFSTMFC